jgi:hypothetical protein
MLKLMKKMAWMMGIVLSVALLSGCGGGGGGGGGNDLPDESSSTAMKQSQGSWNFDNTNNTFEARISLENTLDAKVVLDNFNFYIGGCQVISNTLKFNGMENTEIVFLTSGQSQTLTVTGQLVSGCTPSGFTLTYHEKVEKAGKVREDNYALNVELTGAPGGGVPGEGYAFFNVNTPIDVTQPGTRYEIHAQLLKDGDPVGGATVRLQPFEEEYGTVEAYSVVTGQNDGYARFGYTSPQSLPASGTTKTLTLYFEDENGTRIETEVLLRFGSTPGVAPDYNLTSVTTPVIVQQANELIEISAIVVDKNNVPVSGHQVSITALSDPKYGTIISAATVESSDNGRVSFTYQAPADLAPVDGNETNVELILQEDSYNVTRTVTIKYQAAVEANASKPIIVIPQQERDINLTSNSQVVEMHIQVYDDTTNAPYTDGKVKVKLPDEVLDGVDVGSFDAYEVDVDNNGQAVFTYTGPQDLNYQIDNNHTSAIFRFVHSDNANSEGTVTVHYTPDSDYVSAEYVLDLVSEDGNFTMGLESEKKFAIYLRDIANDVLIDSADILELNVTTKNYAVGKLVETTSGSVTDKLTFAGDDAQNGKNFYLKTETVSGLVPLEISVLFKDRNGVSTTLSVVMNVTVFSGPPTAMSISYVGFRQDQENAKYIEIFNVTVTDAYNNPVNTRPYISTGAIVEYAVDGTSPTGERNSTSPRLWHGFAKDANGNLLDTLGKLEKIGTDEAQFVSDVVNTFRYIDLDNDKLVVFGPGYVYEALGKWDITAVTNSDGTLELRDNYYGSTREQLGFAVGHNNRRDLCSEDAREYVGNMKSTTYQIDSDGHATIEFEYDYHLTGKDIMVWVNLSGYQADNDQTGRIGEAIKHTLRGAGLNTQDSYTLQPGETRVCHFRIHHENAPEWYQNGHFGAAVTGACTVLNIVDTSNAYDARECINGGVAFLDLNVTNQGIEACTISLDGVAVSPEFKSSRTW